VELNCVHWFIIIQWHITVNWLALPVQVSFGYCKYFSFPFLTQLSMFYEPFLIACRTKNMHIVRAVIGTWARWLFEFWTSTGRLRYTDWPLEVDNTRCCRQPCRCFRWIIWRHVSCVATYEVSTLGCRVSFHPTFCVRTQELCGLLVDCTWNMWLHWFVCM